MGYNLYNFSTTAADNVSANTNINWNEGQLAPTLNNSARATMAYIAAFLDVTYGALNSGGSANAYTLTSPTGYEFTAYAQGMAISFKANFTNSGAATVNVDGLGAKSIKTCDGGDVASGDIVSGGVYQFIYDGTNFQIVNTIGSAGPYQPLDATLTAVAALAWSSGNQFPYFTAADTLSLGTITADALSLLADADVPRLGTANSWTSGNQTFAGVLLGPAGAAAAPTYSFSGDPDTGIYSDTANSLRFATGGTLRGTFNSTGFLVQSGALNVQAGSVGAPSLTFSGDTDNGLYYETTNTWHAVANGATLLRFSAATLQVGSGVTLQDASANAYITTARAASTTQLGIIEVATAAEMEAASDWGLAAVAANVNYHPGVAKFWAVVTVSGGVPTLAASHNVTSITDTAAGQLTVNIATDFSSANWAVSAQVNANGAANNYIVNTYTIAAGTILVQCFNGGTLTDPAAWYIVGFGDQ